MIKHRLFIPCIGLLTFLLTVYSTRIVIGGIIAIRDLIEESFIDKMKLSGRYDCISGELYKVDAQGHRNQVWQVDTTSLPCWIIIEK